MRINQAVRFVDHNLDAVRSSVLQPETYIYRDAVESRVSAARVAKVRV